IFVILAQNPRRWILCPPIKSWVSLQVFLLAGSLSAAAQRYQYFRSGNPKDVHTKTTAGFALMGGGKDLDPAFRWLCERAGGGDFLVLRASSDDDYNPYIQGLCHLNSVGTLILTSREAASDPFVAKTIGDAEAVFIAGATRRTTSTGGWELRSSKR